MTDIPDLSTLGPRIMITGMSSAGKSTLTQALARRLGGTAVYLDTLYHQHGTAWEARPAGEFEGLHATAIAGERWAMDGNYMRTMDTRLPRATGIIWLDPNRFGCVYRYFKRSFFDRNRIGRLENAVDSFTWDMVKHILVAQPASRTKMAQLFAHSGLPVVRIDTMAELLQLYAAWGL